MSFWLVWALGALVLALVVAGAVIAAAQLLWRGFTVDVPPIRDRRDDRDPWLLDE